MVAVPTLGLARTKFRMNFTRILYILFDSETSCLPATESPCFHKWGTPKCMVYFMENPKQKRMTGGSPTQETPTCRLVVQLSRWQLNDELGRTPCTSSFRRALDVSHGTLSILDNSATVYTRIWCDYEAVGCSHGAPGDQCEFWSCLGMEHVFRLTSSNE